MHTCTLFDTHTVPNQALFKAPPEAPTTKQTQLVKTCLRGWECQIGAYHLPVAPAKTSPWAGLSDMTAVASTVDARSKVSAPEVVICPEGVTVTGKAEAHLIYSQAGFWALGPVRVLPKRKQVS
jgi:hypothetical protein